MAEAKPYAQSHGNLTVIGDSVRKRVRPDGKSFQEPLVLVRCVCKLEFFMPTTRWKTKPPSWCRKCAIKASKRSGFPGFRVRATL